MRSSQMRLAQYDTDKITNSYLERYDPIFEPLVEKKIVLLELGINKGGSLLLWRDYFALGTIVGIDVRLPVDFDLPERVHVFEGSQADRKFLSQVAKNTAPDGFDVIIDDASHVGELTKIAFWHLFDNHLKPGGLYVIEDWGTGYWDDWPDGKSLDLELHMKPSLKVGALWLLWLKAAARLGLSAPLRGYRPMRGHNYGLVGFVKQLIDEQAAPDVTRANLKGKPKRASKFESMIVTPSIVFIRKATHSGIS